MQSIKNIKNIQGKKIILRADFNVPIKNGKVVDPYRIIKVIPTISYLQKKGAIIILLSHAGEDGTQTLEPISRVLKKYFPVTFIPTSNIKNIKTIISHAVPKTIVLLENIRRFPGEKKNSISFAKEIASMGDIYVNDAFSVSHRAHASIIGVPKLLPSYKGFQLEKEISELSKVFKPKHPFLFILGGAKFDTKLPLIEKFLSSADNIFIGGALINQVFKESGFETGLSLVEKSTYNLPELIKNKKILLPVDMCAVLIKGKKVSKRNSPIDDIRKNENMLDIGKESTRLLIEKIKKAKFILWNGPLGKFPTETKKILDAIAKTKATSIIGGGDTVEVISKYKMEKRFTFVSTGGGATLEFLSKGKLVGIESLK